MLQPICLKRPFNLPVFALLLVMSGTFSCANPTAFSQNNPPKTVNVVQPMPSEGAPRIQVALLLDCSNSMDGLIDQAKSQIWKMVNKLAKTTQNGQVPRLEIALYEYGKTNLAMTDGYIAQLSPLTTDLDKISAMLFGMKTNGGEEYCGYVIRTATDSLQWSDNPNDLKIIIIAGNEPFNQGNVDFRQVCPKANATKGIVINTIHCGDCNEGIKTFWKEGADLGRGEYMCINTDAKVRHVPTPYDDQILRLNQRLNDTYIGYGSRGKARKEMQTTQDSNAAQYGAANAATRAASKSSAAYSNADWDVVDAAKADKKSFAQKMEQQAKTEPAFIPEPFKGLNAAQIEQKIVEMQAEREKLQKEIRDLSLQADDFRAKELAKTSDKPKNTLDAVMLKTVEKQAISKGFKQN